MPSATRGSAPPSPRSPSAPAIPLLAEPLSGARRGPAAIAHYDALLRDDAWPHRPGAGAARRRPADLQAAAHVAGAGSTPCRSSFDPENAWQDPAGAVGTIVAADPRTTLDALAKTLPRKRKDTSWLDAWHAADRAAARAIAGTVGPAGLSEPRVAAELGTLLPPEATLVVASSMPVRDVETFFPVRETPFRVLSNRGANGIDGTVSTAFGVARPRAGPTVLLIGDVALAHDVGGLLAANRLGLKLVIVLIDNDGGGIFHFLPAARAGRGVRRAHRDPARARLRARRGALRRRLRARGGRRRRSARRCSGALAAERTTIVCVRTDREENVALHRRVWESVRAAT